MKSFKHLTSIIQSILLLSFLLSLTSLIQPAIAGEKLFKDPKLESAIRKQLKKPDGEITQTDLESLTKLATINSEIVSLDGIEHCLNLNTLYLMENTITDFSPLSALPKLETLNASFSDNADFRTLSVCVNLKKLTIYSNQISDISWISNLTNLEEIRFLDNNINDISPISNLKNLKTVDFVLNEISDISPLKGLENIETLRLGINHISDISVLSELPNLKSLYMVGNDITDLTPISDLKNLTWIGFGGNEISDLSPLRNLNYLPGMVMQDCQIEDISTLADFTNLTTLTLRNNKISDISALKNMTKLEHLDISSNMIVDLSPLENLVNIKTLLLDRNRIRYITPLNKLTKLEELGISNNYIHDISPILDSPGWKFGAQVTLYSNKFTNEAMTTQIPKLFKKGVVIGPDDIEAECVDFLGFLPSSQEYYARNNPDHTYGSLDELLKSEAIFSDPESSSLIPEYELVVFETTPKSVSQDGTEIKAGYKAIAVPIDRKSGRRIYAIDQDEIIMEWIGSPEDWSKEFSDLDDDKYWFAWPKEMSCSG
jgi:Leucine-rich repeat (LRR) protein